MLETLKHIKKVRRYLLFSAILFITALILNLLFISDTFDNVLLRRFQERFLQVENELELRLDNVSGILYEQSVDAVYLKKHKEFRDLAQERKISIFVFRNDSLLVWSDNRVVESEILPFIAADHQIIELSNCWCYSITRRIRDYKIVGLLLIKSNYGIRNQYLENSFNPVFNLDENVSVKSNTIREKYVVYNNRNTNIFSLDFSNTNNISILNLVIIMLVFLGSVFYVFKAYRKIVIAAESPKRKTYYLLIYGLSLLVVYMLMKYFQFPGFLFSLNIFNLICFNLFIVSISLGDIFAFSLVFYFSIFFAYTEIKINLNDIFKKTYTKDLIRVLLLFLLSQYFFSINNLFEKIVYKIDLSFDVAELFDNGYAYFATIITAALLFAIFVFFTDFIYHRLFVAVNSVKTILLTVFILIFSIVIFSLNKNSLNIQVPLFLLISVSIVIYLRIIKQIEYKYIHVVMVVILFAVYSVFVIYVVSEKKQLNDKKNYARELSNEHDEVAEYLISDFGNKMAFDTTLRRMALKDDIDYPWIYRYIRKKYFAGYWDRYDLQVTICKPSDSVLIHPDNQMHPCFPFFNDLIRQKAEQIKNSNFYFLKNSNGRISYLSSVNYYSLNEKSNIYLQLDSRLNTDALGYPQLLINQSDSKPRKLRNYSYAKYYKEKIAYQSGTFLYNASLIKYPISKDQFNTRSFGGYDHLFYRHDNDNLIILSKPSLRFIDFLVSFSYLFIISFILLNIMLITANPKQYNLKLSSGLKTRIRLSIIGILLLSLFTVAGITIYFITDQYEKRHYQSMGEKLQSVYLELENNLSTETKLKYIWKNEEHNNLESLLRHLSNVFSTDINIFSPDGRMIASSRPEIFEKGISGNYMNSMAFYQMTRNNRIEYIQNEWLGNQKYSSIYTPFVNYQGNVIAYINLPYFTKQSALSEEISTMLLAIINLYIILVLVSLSLAVVISENITKPLKIIQDSIASIKLGSGSGNEKIGYEGQDEIASLIDEYNRKVEELERSVELLSKSERESAWREMAKQVAHEIKNPLTPMKLSIQQLQRSWNDKHEFIDDYFERVTHTLIEQIENLSTIATEFSNFAQMPGIKNEKVDLQKLISDVIALFNNTKIEFIFHFNDQDNTYAWIDREQMTRVFINLITNSIQAIPDNLNGIISIILLSDEEKIEVSIVDNGTGIPNELISRLFQPNFTTKTSGSGLGLAICKNIVENAKGSINFRPGEEKGSVFTIILPKYLG